MKHFLLLLLFFIAKFSFAQTYVKVLGTKEVDDGPSCVLQHQQNFIIGGYAGSLAYLKEVTDLGEELWSITFNFTEYNDIISDIIIDGNYLVGCGYGNISGSAKFDEFFFKMDLNTQEMEWVRNSNLKLKPSKVHIDADGNYLFLGDEYANNKFGLVLLTLNAKNGKENNFATYYYSGKESSSTSIVKDNTIYSGGRYGLKPKVDKFRGSISSFNLGDFSQNWSKYYLNSRTKYVKNYLSSMIIDEDSLVASFFNNNSGITSEFTVSLAKMDLDGQLVWAKEYILEDYSNVTVRDLVAVRDGYLIYGFTRNPEKNLMLLKTDKKGNVVWGKLYSTEFPEDVAVDQGKLMCVANNQIYIVGQTRSVSDFHDMNTVLLRLNADGTLDDECWYQNAVFHAIDYEELIEGEIGLTRYDTIFNIYPTQAERLDWAYDLNGYLCAPGMAKNDFDTIDIQKEITIDVLANDILPIEEQLKLSIVTNPKLGEVRVASNNQITYLPNDSDISCSTDTFSYLLRSSLNQDSAQVIIYFISRSDTQTLQLNKPKNALVQLSPIHKGSEYLWNNGSKSNSVTVSKPGFYEVLIVEGDCRYKEYFEVKEHPYSFEQVATNNITFLLDVSLSMNRSDRLPLMKDAMYRVMQFMRPEDKLSVVSYSDEAQLIFNGVDANKVGIVKAKIDSLSSDGQSDVVGGVILGSSAITDNFQTEGNNRIIFTTDGDVSNDKRLELANAIKKHQPENSFFTIFLFNQSTVYYEQMKELADQVNGQVYVVTSENVEKLLLQEFKAIRK